MSSSTDAYKKLSGAWNQLYTQYHFTKAMSDGDSKLHVAYNHLLREYLFEAESKDFLPSSKYLEKKCAEIWKNAEKIKANGGIIDPDRFDQNAIKQSIIESNFLPVTTDHNEKGEPLPYPYLKGRLILTIKGLSDHEIMVLEKALGAEYDENFDSLNLLAISVPITKPLNDTKEHLVSEYCKRMAQSVLESFVRDNHLGSFDFEYTTIQKVKDFWLNWSI